MKAEDLSTEVAALKIVNIVRKHLLKFQMLLEVELKTKVTRNVGTRGRSFDERPGSQII